MCLTIFHTSHKLTETASFFQMTTLFLPFQKWWCAYENDTLRESSQPPCPLLFRFLLFGFALLGWNKNFGSSCVVSAAPTHQAYKKETSVRKSNVNQVWSLTQFYSVDFSKSRIGVNKCVFYKRTIKVCVSCC